MQNESKRPEPRQNTNLDQQVSLLLTILQEIDQLTSSLQGKKEEVVIPPRNDYFNSDIGEKLSGVIGFAESLKIRLEGGLVIPKGESNSAAR